ncbi:Hypothetical protein AA314_06102 [Archangium gephyra]|uniref:Uncharacterized protein n=1 Tax=Archangium gephyra TaxID=48 RepID=A0AAC8QCA9_9BACT|nr:Hypothetical protein AA314_06102 [Archangium gephyra]
MIWPPGTYLVRGQNEGPLRGLMRSTQFMARVDTLLPPPKKG